MAAIVAGLAVLLLVGWPVAGLVAGLATYFLPGMLSGRTAKERIARLAGIETWIRQIGDGLSGNASLEEALLSSAEHPPPVLAAEVRALARRLRMGVPVADALQAFADDVDHEVGDMAVGALTFAAEARGGGLRQVLTDLARTVARTVETEQQIDAERATHRVTARGVIVALCAFSAFALLNTDYVAPFGSPSGQVMLGFVGALWAVAVRWIHKLANPGPGYRFLRDGRRK
ncbi:type II secretion system F family protein [Actinomadura rayongensis]|uniref:Type II secretion protein F n=1 Tax=Actinomadura rayongensis TaxID=1429076 RepID=A0A6I4WBI6_9ACTN|nr:type II secretion protein F [Actinomadura rayongensis]